jgi:hypothetical protein
LGLVNPEPQLLFDPADRVCATGAAIEQANDHLIDPVDLVTQRVETQLFSHRTYRSTSSNNADD